MGIVEVKDTEQHCFYRAKLLDVKQDQCLVQYEEAEAGPARQAQSWVHSKLVRREPPEQSAVRIEQVPLCSVAVGRPAAALVPRGLHPPPWSAHGPAVSLPCATHTRLGVGLRLARCHASTRAPCPRVPPPRARALQRRGCPPASCALRQGAIVEVEVKADGESEPASWWEAEVKEMRDDFIKVRFLAGGDSIVESLRIRPAFSRGVAPASAPLAKQTIKLTDGLLAWWVLNETRVVADVMPKSQLLAMTLDANAKAMTLFGSEKSIATAKMLVDIHAKHQACRRPVTAL